MLLVTLCSCLLCNIPCSIHEGARNPDDHACTANNPPRRCSRGELHYSSSENEASSASRHIKANFLHCLRRQTGWSRCGTRRRARCGVATGVRVGRADLPWRKGRASTRLPATGTVSGSPARPRKNLPLTEVPSSSGFTTRFDTSCLPMALEQLH